MAFSEREVDLFSGLIYWPIRHFGAGIESSLMEELSNISNL